MQTPYFTGPDAPIAALDGDVLSLVYETLHAYAVRIHGDHMDLATAPGVRVVESWLPPQTAGDARIVVRYRIAEAPVADVVADAPRARKSR